jgi:site-specific recombinase XerD
MNVELKQMTQDLALKGYAEGTRSRYLKTAEELTTRFGRPAAELERNELREYVAELQAKNGSPEWLNTRLAALRFLYCRTLGKPELVSFISYRKRHTPLPVVLSLEEVGALLNAIETPRYQAMAMVMYGAGLRIGETRLLQTQDIDGARGVIRVRHGKGNKPREAKLSPSLYQWLRRYWAQHRPPAPYLFASATGRLPSRGTTLAALRKAAKAAGVKKRVTNHVLRHSYATHLLEEGTDIHVVSKLLGHSSLRTTVRYAQVTEKLVRQAPTPLDLLPQGRR